jgi:uncharacterized protein
MPTTRPMRPGLTRRRALAGTLGALAAAATPSPSAAAAPPDRAKTVRSFQEIRRKSVVIQRWDLSCGAAALATVLAFQHGDPVPEREIARAMLAATDSALVRERLGFSLLDLKRFLKGRGYAGEGYARVGLAGLALAIVPIRLQTFDHFVVFRGLERGRAILADSAYGVRAMAVGRFLRAWRGRVAFVVRRGDRPPAPNLLALPDADLLLVPEQAVRAALP